MSQTGFQIWIFSSAALLQLAPAVIGGVFWKGATRRGVLLGLGSGFLLWGYTLLLPAMVRGGWLEVSILEQGPFGIGWLRPEQLFGIEGLDALSHSVFWSLFFNLVGYTLGSTTRRWRRASPHAGPFADAATDRGERQSTAESELVDLDEKSALLRREIAERQRAERALQASEDRFRSMVNNLNIGIYRLEPRHGRLIETNPAMAHIFGFTTGEQLMRHSVADFFEDPVGRDAFLEEVLEAGFTHNRALRMKRHDGAPFIASVSATIHFDENGEPDWADGIIEDITDRTRAEQRLKETMAALEQTQEQLEQLVEERTAELQQTQAHLFEASRKAGMAEVAAGVLHNVGNVLNSVNVAASLVRDIVQRSRLDGLTKAVNLMEQHRDNLGAFLTQNHKGKHLVTYLSELSKILQDEREDVMTNIQALSQRVDHIKNIVALQQSYARMGGTTELCALSDLVEDAVNINWAGLRRHTIELVRDFDSLPDVECERHMVLQILVNLVSNATYAMAEDEVTERVLTMRIKRCDEDRAQVVVADTGIGISPENLSLIFNHGFTTRKDGHGFGLHSSANAAAELGGALSAHSEGTGRGAVFTLTLPLRVAKDHDQSEHQSESAKTPPPAAPS